MLKCIFSSQLSSPLSVRFMVRQHFSIPRVTLISWSRLPCILLTWFATWQVIGMEIQKLPHFTWGAYKCERRRNHSWKLGNTEYCHDDIYNDFSHAVSEVIFNYLGPWVQCRFFLSSRNAYCLCKFAEVMDVFIHWTVIIISQCICTLNHHVYL